MYAGQQLAAQPEKPSEIEPANIQRVTAWTHGQLMFDNEPLADVVARVNRYTDTLIEIDGNIYNTLVYCQDNIYNTLVYCQEG